MLQRPDATMCQSFTNWKEMNRFVRKGEKGIRILAPAPYKMQKEQDKMDASGRPVLDKDGEICDIQVNYGESYSHQMLRYSQEYGTLI